MPNLFSLHIVPMTLLYKAHLLNIDTALGAVVSCNFFAKILGLPLPWSINASLFISVLIIYNFDHLSDAGKISGQAQTVRHQFYKDNDFMLKLLQFALMLSGIFLIYFLPQEIIKAGGFIVLSILLYFIVLEIIPIRFIFFKEVSIAAIYTLAIVLAPAILSIKPISAELVLLTGQIFLLAFMNLIIFSVFDKDVDEQEGHPSLVYIVGVKRITGWTYAMFALFFTCVLFSFIFIGSQWEAQIIILIMGLILLLLLSRVNFFKQNDRFRIVGDSVFLLPGIFLLVG